ncbi:PH domain-containing protein [Metabacillus bambusae]|uniref:PH domain-containing protein n=1 Tax=Metabacillus bambusae TaxID=2795218 RepID=A0ABS3N5P6_9BACI|nr:PH domain-containing protein [Metabacillus bambusae]MBO1513622.1 PH domain-containing protein [Metabacillus bambusae]
MMMFEPKRIHPVGMILSFLKIIKSYIFPFILFFFFGNNDFNLYFIIGASCLFVIIVVTSILDWWKFTYWIEDGELRIKHGVFIKKKRYIPIERIQSINTTAGIIQQIFQLVKVQIETAGGGLEAEAVLTAIKRQEADRIQNAIAMYKKDVSKQIENQNEDQNEDQPQLPTFKMEPKDLFVAASTSSGIGVIISAIAAFFSQFDEFIPYEDILDRFEILTNASFALYAVLVFIAFFIAWILSIIGVLLKYAYFTVVKAENELRISSGIFEKRQVSIPIPRIQAIRIVQNPLRQLLGYATVYIESAGGSAGDEGASTILFPVVPKKAISPLLSQYLPLFENSDKLQRLPKRSMQRYMFRKIIPALIICIPVSYFLAPWGFLSLILIPISAYWGYFSYKDTGWKLNGNQMQLGFRIISKTTVLIHRNRLQSFKSKTSYFQKKKSLQTLEVWIKSGIIGRHFTIKDLEENDLEQLGNWYSYSKE